VTESHLAKGAPQTLVTNAITFRGQDLVPLRAFDGTFINSEGAPSYVLTGQWTFTSPTIYLAHRPIKAEYWTNTMTMQMEYYGWGFAFSDAHDPTTTSVLIRSAGVTALGPNDPIYSQCARATAIPKSRIPLCTLNLLRKDYSIPTHPRLRLVRPREVLSVHFNFGICKIPFQRASILMQDTKTVGVTRRTAEPLLMIVIVHLFP
jgi:hypothetical protein